MKHLEQQFFIAHKDIEGIAMDREVMRLVSMLSPKFAE
jgi:hypothetical protein